MRFSIKWAASSPVYVGLVVGVFLTLTHAASMRGWVTGVMVGLFMGASFGIPAAASNLVAAVAAATLGRRQPFFVTFALYCVGSAMLNTLMLRWLDQEFHGIGGVIGGTGNVAAYLAFGLASLVVAWISMRLEAGAHH